MSETGSDHGFASERSTIGVVILSWENIEQTVQAAHSYLTAGVDEVWVVDNGSMEISLDGLQSRLPKGVNLLRLRENVGYSRGMNAGLQCAVSDVVLLSNNDVLATDTQIAWTRQEIRECDLVFFPSPSGPSDAIARPYPSGVRVLATSLGLHRLFLRQRLSIDSTDQPDWYEGACLAATTSTWDLLGGVPELTHMYGEEVLLCRRADRVGVVKRLAAAPLGQHHDGLASTKRWPSSRRYAVISNGYWRAVVFEWGFRARCWALTYAASRFATGLFRPGPRGALPLAEARGILFAAFGREIL